MMAHLSIKNILLILVINLLFYLTRINGESLKEAWEKGSKNLSRQKREDGEGPEVIKIKIQKDGTEEEIEVSKLKENYIANENLKVWAIHSNTSNGKTELRLERINNAIEEVGKWDMYRSKTTNSAVVYFRKSKLLGGIIGNKRYIINFINYTGSNEITLTDPPHEVSTRKKRETKKIVQELADSFSAMKRIRKSANNTTVSPKIEFYLESLVLINRNLTNSFSSPIPNIEILTYKFSVMYVLTFFNLIDMRFPPAFKINVAGILLEQEILPQDNLVNFLQQHDSQIGSNTYDYIIQLYKGFINNGYTEKNIYAYLSYPTQGIYAARKLKSLNSHPIIYTSNNFTYTSVSHAADQIHHILRGRNYVNLKNSTESYVVITDDIHNCKNCSSWNEDWCVFVNKPHSLGPTPRKLLTVDEQCWCSNYNYRYKNTTNKVAVDICANGFQCQNINDNSIINVTMVMNGTACGEKKICWNNECVSEV